MFTDVISILFQIAILIAPTVMAISASYLIILMFKLKLSIDDIHGLEVYIFQKEEYITAVKVAKVAFSNILFGHIMATGFLAMSRIDLSNNWLVRA